MGLKDMSRTTSVARRLRRAAAGLAIAVLPLTMAVSCLTGEEQDQQQQQQDQEEDGQEEDD